MPLSPAESRTIKHWLAPAEHGLPPSIRADAWHLGANLALDRVLSCALELPLCETAQASPKHSLSTREREVVALVSQGLSNREIAARLIIGERTVESHVSSSLRKLELSSRVGLAGWAAQHGLNRVRDAFRAGTDDGPVLRI
jgi:DNA-binding NarL/FixJ family response regulator